MREKQVALGGAFSPVDRAGVVVARIAHGSDAERQLLEAVVVVRDMHVAVPHAGHERFAFAVDELCTCGRLYLSSRADRSDGALVYDHGLVWQEAQVIGIEHLDVGKGNRCRRSFS